MKVNLIVNSFPTPSETFLFNLVVGLESTGVDVTVISSTSSSYTHFYKHRLHEWSGKIKYIPGRDINGLIKLILILLKKPKLLYELMQIVGFKKGMYLCAVYDTIIHNQPHIVHFSFSGVAIEYQSIISELNKYCKTVISCRGSGEKVKPVIDNSRRIKLASLLNEIDLVHCVSEDMLLTIANYADVKYKSFVNYPSIQIENFNLKENQPRSTKQVFEIVTTGRLCYQKGYVFALEALLKLKQAGYLFHYHILGEGSDREMLEYIIHDMKLSDNVTLHGRVDGELVKKFLINSDIFLLPSIYEGISNAALEAMCVGIPIVSTNAGGMGEVIVDGVNGRVVPTYSSYVMYEAIKWTIDNYEISIQMSIKAKETVVSKHSQNQQISIFLDHYRQILS